MNKGFTKYIQLNIAVLIAVCIIALAGCNGNTTKQERIDKAKQQDKEQHEAKKTIVFFGNSLTAGYGLDPSESFPTLIQNKIDSAGYNYKVLNAGVSGETSAGGSTRIDWMLKQPMDIFVLELGANDGLRGVPVKETKKNLQLIINKVKTAYPDAKIILAGMQVPPNMGRQYGQDFSSMFADLAKENDIPLIPFLLAGVGGERNLNLEDGIHPNAAGQKIVAENVWNVLQKELEK